MCLRYTLHTMRSEHFTLTPLIAPTILDTGLSTVLIGTAIPKRYCVAKSGVLESYDNSVAENTRLASRGVPKPVKHERKRKGTDAETVDLILG